MSWKFQTICESLLKADFASFLGWFQLPILHWIFKILMMKRLWNSQNSLKFTEVSCDFWWWNVFEIHKIPWSSQKFRPRLSVIFVWKFHTRVKPLLLSTSVLKRTSLNLAWVCVSCVDFRVKLTDKVNLAASHANSHQILGKDFPKFKCACTKI